MKEDIPYFEDKKSQLIPNQPIVERNTVNAIVYNPSNDKILCLYWEKFDWKTFVIGGVDEGEDAIKASCREIKEETGYTDIKFIKEIGRSRSRYYAAHKKENRISNTTGLLFELVTDAQLPLVKEESKHHDYLWVPRREVSSFVNLQSQKYIWEKTLKLLG